ncbi:MAG: hypothetical protein QM784_02510 [Polyangiaceae bacterium]
MKPKRTGPGLVKSKQAPLLERRVRGFVRCTDYRWRELFDHAEILSEGAVRTDAEGRVYYGSTHIRLFDGRLFGANDAVARNDFRQLMERDPHARLRAMRIACLEAQVRSGTSFEWTRTEVRFSSDSDAIDISIDVEARLVREGRVGRLHHGAR